jgi:hypothetical protein
MQCSLTAVIRLLRDGVSTGLSVLGPIAVAFYIAGLYKMGLAAGLFAFNGTLWSFVFFWPIGIVVLLAIGLRTAAAFQCPREPVKPSRPMALPWWPRAQTRSSSRAMLTRVLRR